MSSTCRRRQNDYCAFLETMSLGGVDEDRSAESLILMFDSATVKVESYTDSDELYPPGGISFGLSSNHGGYNSKYLLAFISSNSVRGGIKLYPKLRLGGGEKPK